MSDSEVNRLQRMVNRLQSEGLNHKKYSKTNNNEALSIIHLIPSIIREVA